MFSSLVLSFSLSTAMLRMSTNLIWAAVGPPASRRREEVEVAVQNRTGVFGEGILWVLVRVLEKNL